MHTGIHITGHQKESLDVLRSTIMDILTSFNAEAVKIEALKTMVSLTVTANGLEFKNLTIGDQLVTPKQVADPEEDMLP